MAVYRIYRLKETARQSFRQAPHTAGLALAKVKDYEHVRSVEASTCYRAWLDLKNTEDALQPGDILESDSGELRIYEYIGFEQAQWQLPEIKAAPETGTAASAQPPPSV